eukprot:CCRYP_012402-RA/>CCRYP_012402-RA protein AED:0.42 eAED:0.42 QI:0/-1/0/1/-1/1/1/0/91
MFRLLTLVSFAELISSAVPNDGWEFQGGKWKRRTHGFTSATKEQAPRRKCAVHYKDKTKSITEISITNDEAPPALKSRQIGQKTDQAYEIT